MLDLYQSQILDRSRNPHFRGTVSPATHRGEGANLSCGDEVQWTLRVENGVITDIRHDCRACAVCSASADLLATSLHQKDFHDIQKWNTEQITELVGIPLSPIRLKCALLPLEALKAVTEVN